jgi:hypothetical protein
LASRRGAARTAIRAPRAAAGGDGDSEAGGRWCCCCCREGCTLGCRPNDRCKGQDTQRGRRVVKPAVTRDSNALLGRLVTAAGRHRETKRHAASSRGGPRFCSVPRQGERYCSVASHPCPLQLRLAVVPSPPPMKHNERARANRLLQATGGRGISG